MALSAHFNACVLYPLAERWLGRGIRGKLMALRRQCAQPWMERRRHAVQCLAETLQAAGRHVPYYRDLFQKHAIDPARVSADPRYLRDIPFLTKEILRGEGRRLLDERYAGGVLHLRKTGGSTGPAAEIFYTHAALDWTAACHRLVLEWTHKKPYHREIHISSRFPEAGPWRDRLREWIKCTALNRWNLCTDALDPGTLDMMEKTLRRVRPFLVQGHPSTLYALALHLSQGARPRRPYFQVFETSGETLGDKQRRAIEEVLGCRVFNRYGNAEFGVLAHQTVPEAAAPLRLLENVAWPESVHIGDAGPELVFTGLLNPGMPLIRYRTGDLGEVREDADGLRLHHLQGRVHDLVVINGRRYPTHYVQDVLDRLGGIDEFQCQQLPDERLRLRLVVPDPAQHARLTEALAEWWGAAVVVEFTDLAGLERQGTRGKFRHLVNAAAYGVAAFVRMRATRGSSNPAFSRTRLREFSLNDCQRITVFHAPADAFVAELVRAAFARTFTAGQVAVAGYDSFSSSASGVVIIHPPAELALHFSSLATGGKKILVLGRLTGAWPAQLGLKLAVESRLRPGLADSAFNRDQPWTQSALSIRYGTDHVLSRACPIPQRPLCRYDFADEWNNLGFGRIPIDDSPWSLVQDLSCAGAVPLAEIIGLDGAPALYLALRETDSAAMLWCNRAVGPIDSLEWAVIEAFFGDYRPGRLACFPYLREIPWGYDAAATVRLDCDEAIASARGVFELCQGAGIPLSLAVKTGQPIGTKDVELLRDVIGAGGAVLSHSVHHYANWGGSKERARAEADRSRRQLEALCPEAGPVRYAVSPFHQNPPYAVEALAESGYHGFVGGLIRNDPEYLLGRAGAVPGNPGPFVSHSQQCMMHGDCWHRGSGIEPYLANFAQHRRAQGIFGYLDHPFSQRYQYGWSSERERCQAHRLLLEGIQAAGRVWWPNLNECLDFLKWRSGVRIAIDQRERLTIEQPPSGRWRLALRWRGETIEQA